MKSLSIVVPVLNEEKNIPLLVGTVHSALQGRVKNLEFVFVNDGSSDGSKGAIIDLKAEYDVLYLENKKRKGQGYSLLTGMQEAKYDVLLTLDADLPVEPEDLIKIVIYKEALNLDFICSRRKKRVSENIYTHLPSRLGNILISLFFNTDFTDVGSPLKILEKKDILNLKPFKNFHRYLSIILHFKGLHSEEITVTYRPRQFGKSKYGSTKFIRVIFELFYLKYYLSKLRS